jgi:hypothetical protein
MTGPVPYQGFLLGENVVHARELGEHPSDLDLWA